MDPHADELLEPLLADQIVVRFAHARGDPNNQLVLDGRLQSQQRLVVNILRSATLVADQIGPFDADQRRGIARLTQPTRNLVRDQLAIGEDLKVTILVCLDHIEQVRMHERLATENPKIAVPVLLRVGDDPVEIVFADHLPWRRDVNPASLASQLARIDHRNK